MTGASSTQRLFQFLKMASRSASATPLRHQRSVNCTGGTPHSSSGATPQRPRSGTRIDRVVMMAGMKRLYEEQKKLQTSTNKIEKIVEEMQQGVEQTVSSKMPIPCTLSVSLE